MTLFILGAGGFSREVAYVLYNNINDFFEFYRFAGYLSDNKEQWRTDLPFARVCGSIDEYWNAYPGDDIKFIPAVGSPQIKQSLVSRAEEKKWKAFKHIQHQQSFVGDAEIGDGSIVCSMCSITTNVKIGKYVNVNLNCTIGHDAVIEDYVNLSPHCTISGKVYIEKYCDLGSGVDVLPGVRIGEGSVIGAGAVVVKDVPPHSLVVGVPGKVVKTLDDPSS